MSEPDHIYLGNPCKYHHDGRRYKATRACVECQRSRFTQGRNAANPPLAEWLAAQGTEGWRDIPGYEGRYQAHPDGLVRSLPRPKSRGGLLRQRSAIGGYRRVGFAGDGELGPSPLVHKIIMLTFVGPRPPGLEVGHYNGDAADNRLSNLAYITKKDNEADKVRHGTSRPRQKSEASHVAR